MATPKIMTPYTQTNALKTAFRTLTALVGTIVHWGNHLEYVALQIALIPIAKTDQMRELDAATMLL